MFFSFASEITSCRYKKESIQGSVISELQSPVSKNFSSLLKYLKPYPSVQKSSYCFVMEGDKLPLKAIYFF